MTVEFDRVLLKNLSDRLASEIGIHFADNRLDDLHRRLQDLSEKLGYKTFDKFVTWLLSVEWNQERLDMLAQSLTIAETYFFRDASLWEFLEKEILPNLLSQICLSKPKISFWSAASCTGEEAYTLAMILKRIAPNLNPLNFQISASDINPQYLDHARAGLYTTWALRATSADIKSTFFTEKGERKYQLCEEIRSMVSFHHHNLVTPPAVLEFEPRGGFDLIFCRNVLIYFPELQTRQTIKDLAKRLAPGGILVLSPQDCWCADAETFETIFRPGVVVLRKRSADKQHTPPLRSAVATVAHTASAAAMAGKSVATNTAQPPSPLPLPIKPSLPPTPVPPEVKEVAAASPVVDLATIRAQLDGGKVALSLSQLIEMASNGDRRPELYRLIVDALIQNNDKGQAINWVDQAIKMYPLEQKFYYVKACLLQDSGEIERAVSTLRQCLFVDPDFAMAHFTMSSLLRSLRKADEAEVYLRNTIRLLERFKPDDSPPESGGLTAAQLLSIVNQRRIAING